MSREEIGFCTKIERPISVQQKNRPTNMRRIFIVIKFLFACEELVNQLQNIVITLVVLFHAKLTQFKDGVQAGAF